MSARVAMLVALVALSGCRSQPLRALLQPSKGDAALSAGLREYDNGQYAEAARNLQTGIDLGLTDRERAKAHKYLAFIHCASGRERSCRDEFKRALAVEPELELPAAEAGHPVWGPVFAQLKAEPSSF